MTCEATRHVPNPKGGKGRKKAPPREPFGIEIRLRCGTLSSEELADLSGVSIKKIYADEKAGLLSFIKRGARTRISGPVASKYLGLLSDAE